MRQRRSYAAALAIVITAQILGPGYTAATETPSAPAWICSETDQLCDSQTPPTTRVVQMPNRTVTYTHTAHGTATESISATDIGSTDPRASGIPVAGTDSKIAVGWLPSSVATGAGKGTYIPKRGAQTGTTTATTTELSDSPLVVYNGKIGLGTELPDASLHLYGIGKDLEFTNDSGGGVQGADWYVGASKKASIKYNWGSGDFEITQSAGAYGINFLFGSTSSLYLRRANSRRGMGTTDPGAQLHISYNDSTVVATPMLRLDNPSSDAVNNGGSLDFNQGGSQKARIRYYYTIANGWAFALGHTTNDDIIIDSSGYVHIKTRLLFDGSSSGSVTATPASNGGSLAFDKPISTPNALGITGGGSFGTGTATATTTTIGTGTLTINPPVTATHTHTATDVSGAVTGSGNKTYLPQWGPGTGTHTYTDGFSCAATGTNFGTVTVADTSTATYTGIELATETQTVTLTVAETNILTDTDTGTYTMTCTFFDIGIVPETGTTASLSTSHFYDDDVDGVAGVEAPFRVMGNLEIGSGNSVTFTPAADGSSVDISAPISSPNTFAVTGGGSFGTGSATATTTTLGTGTMTINIPVATNTATLYATNGVAIQTTVTGISMTTFSATATATGTATATTSGTGTLVGTWTESGTSTSTDTSSGTYTATASMTDTPGGGSSSISTKTLTVTVTATVTVTSGTNTGTTTASSTATVTKALVSQMPYIEHTATGTFTRTATGSGTRTWSSTSTHTNSFNWTDTFTATATGTVTGSYTWVTTATATQTATAASAAASSNPTFVSVMPTAGGDLFFSRNAFYEGELGLIAYPRASGPEYPDPVTATPVPGFPKTLGTNGATGGPMYWNASDTPKRGYVSAGNYSFWLYLKSTGAAYVSVDVVEVGYASGQIIGGVMVHVADLVLPGDSSWHTYSAEKWNGGWALNTIGDYVSVVLTAYADSGAPTVTLGVNSYGDGYYPSRFNWPLNLYAGD